MKQTTLYLYLLIFLISCNNSTKSQLYPSLNHFYTLTQNDTFLYYYSKTNFNFIDTIEYWKYNLDKNYKPEGEDSITPIALITFWRALPLYDSISIKVYKKFWTPSISYEIFNLADSSYCYKQSIETRYLSSCVPPNVGGDIFIIGHFIFLNRDVCINCGKYDTGIDYCRPIINLLISKIDRNKINTLDEIIEQFLIKQE